MITYKIVQPYIGEWRVVIKETGVVLPEAFVSRQFALAFAQLTAAMSPATTKVEA